MVQAQTIVTLAKHITGARFETYLALARNNPYDALALYRWNMEMSGALQEALGVAEVFLRNALDAELRIWNAAQPSRPMPTGTLVYNEEWVQLPAGSLYAILNPAPRRGGRRFSTYDDARTRAENDRNAREPGHRRHGRPVDHDDVVAHMTFGTWNKLLPRRDMRHSSGLGPQAQRALWNAALCKAFPNHPHPTVIKYWVDRLHAIRNRVAHLEPLCDTDVMSYHRTIARLLRAIDPALSSWYGGVSRIPEVLSRKPSC
ncbi:MULTISPECIES: Swt1 family HEPN domain-containing protein [Rhodococcus]|uniref:Swt1 family HEPN domain-containing protein n=1 Tax=Rhodococcus TaxID=1827 RepID=UPI0004A8FBF1|nr:Swt1 family HEPN domain-containing protein [Rhodococcus qingshengii]KDQ00188.1 hypothetical protein EN35_03410 [Rhodococcus qingshengii]MBP1054900.1 hypothetical protein [Rhodococcus qingshengii]NHP18640.1 hypothetical protein [Rhodococcus sp. IC4_135]QEM25308.1 hypothetical protein D6M20_00020 [Rhodococcus qingshengii]